MGVRIVFKDPNLGERTFTTATKWETAANEKELIISAGAAKLAQFQRDEIFSLEIV